MSYRVRVAIVYLLGFFIDLVNMFIANVAYPEMARHFAAPVSQLAWVSNAYILGLTLVIPLSRWWMERVGAKRLFILSLIIFMASSAGVATSQSMFHLIGWRLLQGIGGGLLIPIGQTMTYALYRSHERAKLSSAVMLVALLAPALAPAAGGLLIEILNWRWVFLASLPLVIVALVLAILWLNVDKPTAEVGRLDLVGLISGCSGLTLILLGLTSLGESQLMHQGALMLLGGLIVFGGYVWNALGKSQPLVNLHLAKDPLLQTAMLIYQFVPGAFTGVSLIAMLYLQNEFGLPAAFVGALMLPWSAASFIAISVTGKWFNTLGPRPLFIIGSITQALGIGVLATIGHPASAVVCVIAFCLMGFGGSLCSSTAQSSAFLQIPDEQLADASAIWNINRQLSFCLGVTLVTLLFNLLANSSISVDRAYRLCFLLAACSAIVPVICCLRIANRKILFTLNQEKK